MICCDPHQLLGHGVVKDVSAACSEYSSLVPLGQDRGMLPLFSVYPKALRRNHRRVREADCLETSGVIRGSSVKAEVGLASRHGRWECGLTRVVFGRRCKRGEGGGKLQEGAGGYRKLADLDRWSQNYQRPELQKVSF
jgi:hypothetical protein